MDSIQRSDVKLFVGNLPFTTTIKDLECLFGKFGQLIGVKLVSDQATGRPRGFAFVTFSSEDDAETAMTAMNQYELEGRTLTVRDRHR